MLFSGFYTPKEALFAEGTDSVSDIYSLASTLAHLLFPTDISLITEETSDLQVIKKQKSNKRISKNKIKKLFAQLDTFLNKQNSEEAVINQFNQIKEFVMAGIEEDYLERLEKLEKLETPTLKQLLSEVKNGKKYLITNKRLAPSSKKNDLDKLDETNFLLKKLSEGAEIPITIQSLRSKKFTFKQFLVLLELQNSVNFEIQKAASYLLITNDLFNFKSLLIFGLNLKKLLKLQSMANNKSSNSSVASTISILKTILEHYHPQIHEWLALRTSLSNDEVFDSIFKLEITSHFEMENHENLKKLEITLSSQNKLKGLSCYSKY